MDNTSTQPLDFLKEKTKNFLSQQKINDKMNISSFTGTSDISQYEKTIDEKTLTAQNSLLGSYYIGRYGESKSFLEIEVNKWTYKSGKGKGSLTGLWSFSHTGNRGNKGFVTFNKAETSSTEKKLILTGGFYTTAKNGSNQQGVIDQFKEVKEENGKFLDKSNFDKYFPKPYWYTKMGGFDKYGYNNGGFIDGASDLDKICGVNDPDCSDSNLKEFKQPDALRWEGYGDSGYGTTHCNNWPTNVGCDHVGNGSGDKNSKSELQGYDYMYGNVGKLRLKHHLNPFFRGSWRPVKK